MAHRVADRRLREHGPGQRLALGVDLRKERHRPFLSQGASTLRVEVRGIAFDVIELLNQSDRQRRGRVDQEGFDEAAARVRPAANLEDAPALIQPVIADVGIGLQPPAEVDQECGRPVAFMCRGRVEDDLAGERIEIGPEPALVAAPRSSSTVTVVSSVCR